MMDACPVASARKLVIAAPPPDVPPDAPYVGARHRNALIAILIGVALATIDTAIANTALPTIAVDLHARPAASVWIINAYQLAVVATLLPFAAVGDLVGPRRIYLGGIALFTLTSLACALSPSLAALTVSRALQGIGAGALMSVNVALIRLIYPPATLGRGVGLNALVVGVSFAIGPTITSLVLSVANWPWLFALNVPLGILAFVSGVASLPRSERRTHQVDAAAAIYTGIAFATLILALGSAAQRERWPLVVGPLLVSALAFALLLRRQADHAAPMLPIDLLRRPVFALSTLTAMGSFAAQGLAFVSLPFYFQSALGRSAVDSGFLMTPWPVVVAMAAPIAGRLSDRYPSGLLGGIGLAVLCAGMASLAAMPAQPSVWSIVVRMAICGIGFGMFQSPNLRAIMSSAPHERSGAASGVIGMARLIGQTTGAALVALCFGLAGSQVSGSTWSLELGAVFAALAAVASTARLMQW